MSAISIVNVALALVNCGLAVVLGAIYWRNHRDIRSPFTLGLLLFALFLFVHNAIFVYHTFTMMEAADASADTLLLIEGLLQLAASGTLVAATLR
jgi:hypothetical protein